MNFMLRQEMNFVLNYVKNVSIFSSAGMLPLYQ